MKGINKLTNSVYEYEINETLKVSLYLEEWSYSIFDALGDGFGVYMINSDFRHHNLGDLGQNIAQVLEGVDYARYSQIRRRYDDDLTEALSRMFKRQNRDFKLICLTNYHEATLAVVYGLEAEDKITSGLADALDAWFKGEIYTMALEELAVYTNLANGDTLNKFRFVSVFCTCKNCIPNCFHT